jgi:hypothetical protein
MRGLIAVAAVCGAMLLTAGCGDRTVQAGRGNAPPAKFVKPSVVAGVSPDPRAQAICDDVRGNVLNADAKAFGAELGRMMAARVQKDRAGEDRAYQAATAKLGQIAGKLRTHAAEATDPRFRQALNASATNLDKLGTDAQTLANLDSLDAVSKTTASFAGALGDAAEYCGA